MWTPAADSVDQSILLVSTRLISHADASLIHNNHSAALDLWTQLQGHPWGPIDPKHVWAQNMMVPRTQKFNTV